MRVLVRAPRPLQPGPAELCSCPDTHDRGVAWSWSVSGMVGDGGLDDVIVSDDDARVSAESSRVELGGGPMDLDLASGEELVLVVMREDVELLAEDGWRASLGAGDVLVSDGEQERRLQVSGADGATVHVVRLRWREDRPMRWVP